MMWIDGVDPLDVLEAFVAAGAAMLIFASPPPAQQLFADYQDAAAGVRVDCRASRSLHRFCSPDHRQLIVNVSQRVFDRFRYLRGGRNLHRRLATLVAAPARSKQRVPSFAHRVRSLMPVEKLPAASWQTALGLGFVPRVRQHRLTALALKQGGYDWAISRMRSASAASMSGSALPPRSPFQHVSAGQIVGLWLSTLARRLAYVIGFFVLYASSAGIRTRAKNQAAAASRHPARRFMA